MKTPRARHFCASRNILIIEIYLKNTISSLRAMENLFICGMMTALRSWLQACCRRLFCLFQIFSSRLSARKSFVCRVYLGIRRRERLVAEKMKLEIVVHLGFGFDEVTVCCCLERATFELNSRTRRSPAKGFRWNGLFGFAILSPMEIINATLKRRSVLGKRESAVQNNVLSSFVLHAFSSRR